MKIILDFINCFFFFLTLGPFGCSGDLHGGVFLYRGSVSVFRPLEHRLQLGCYSQWDPGVLPDCKALLRTDPLEKSLQ